MYPLGLDFSIAGHVESGETYDEALIKEAAEEVSLDLALIPYKEIGYLTPHNGGVAAFQKIYEIESDVAPDFKTDDFIDFEWLSPAEVIEKFEFGVSMKSDIVDALKACYL